MSEIHIGTAANLPEDVRQLKPVAVLSIEHPGAVDGAGRAPRLYAEHGIKVAQYIQSFWDVEYTHPQGPTPERVKAGLSFLTHYADQGPVIVHCRQGKARSTAMALGFMAATAAPGTDAEALIARLKAQSPGAGPNILVVRYADAVLGLKGGLERAVLNDPDLTRNRTAADQGRQRWAEKNPGMVP